MKIRRRQCNNPAPAHGGDHCPGHNTNSAPCNMQNCPGNVNIKSKKLLNTLVQ